jgi:hypothetical protein
MTASLAVRTRSLLAGVLLVAGLLLLPASPVAAQACRNHQCRFVQCYWVQGNVFECRQFTAGCYSSDNCWACCNCPVPGGSACVETMHVLTGDGLTPEEILVTEGKRVCHELLRLRLGVERSVLLFDDDSSRAALAGPDRVSVEGLAHPDGVPSKDATAFTPETERAPARRFTCEVQRDFKEAWSAVSLTLSEGDK